MERARNNVYSPVNCWWLIKKSRLCMCWLWKVPFFSCSKCSKWYPFAFTHAHNRFFHWPTASMVCDMLVNAALHQVASLVDKCLVRCTHIPASVAKICSRSGFRVNQTVWRTLIWRGKIRCFLLKELDCFTSIEWHQNASFRLQLFKSK